MTLCIEHKIENLINISNYIFMFVVIGLFGKFLSQWVLASRLIKTVAPLLIIYTVVLAIVSMITVFLMNTYHIHKLMVKLKKSELKIVNDKYKNIHNDVFNSTNQNYSDKISLILYEKERIGKIKEWPIDTKIIVQTIIGIIIAITPLIINYFSIL